MAAQIAIDPEIFQLSQLASGAEIESAREGVLALQLNHEPCDVFEVFGTDGHWRKSLNNEELEHLLKDSVKPRARYIFLKPVEDPSLHRLFIAPDLSAILLTLVPVSRCMRLCLSCGLDGNITPFSTAVEHKKGSVRSTLSSYTYMWGQGGPHSFECSLDSAGSLTCIVFVLPPFAQAKFCSWMSDNPSLAAYPLALGFTIGYIQLEGLERYSIISNISGHELEVLLEPSVETDAIDDLRKGMNNALIRREIAANLEHPMENIEKFQELLANLNDDSLNALATEFYANTSISVSELRALHMRAESTNMCALERSQAYLSLMLHRSNLAEARANQALARQSTELAKQSTELSKQSMEFAQQSRDLTKQSTEIAQQSRDLGQYTAILAQQTSADSASMITIAAVTMFFLPATFVSSLFSMGFFIFSDDGSLRTSERVWIYPAVVVPLTVTVFATWLTWIKFRPNKVQKQIEGLNLSIKRRDTVVSEKNEP